MGNFRKNIEIKTVYSMIELYCHRHHNQKKGLCPSCSSLYEYAVKKYTNCPFGTQKPVCSKCTVHCYAKKQREDIKKIMRYSGPRMILYHPIQTIIYLYHKLTIPSYSLEKVKLFEKNK